MLDKFDFEGKKVRTFGTWDNPLFIAKDVCKILGIKYNRNAVLRVDEDEMTSVPVNGYYNRKVAGVTKKVETTIIMTAVTESGLYALIFQSIKPEAKRFKKHVTSVVLPEIRKTGSYNGQHKGFQYGNKVLPFETEIPQAYRGLGEGAVKWEKTFPDEFYKEIYRIWGFPILEPFHQHPLPFAKITTMLIYNELFSIAPMKLRDELALLRCKDAELKASIMKEGDKQGKAFSKLLHQYLSDEGREQLRRCLMTMIVIMRMSGSKYGLRDNLLKYHGQLDFLSA